MRFVLRLTATREGALPTGMVATTVCAREVAGIVVNKTRDKSRERLFTAASRPNRHATVYFSALAPAYAR